MLSSYYADPHVRARISEFLGGASLEQATCAFVTSNRRTPSAWYDPQPVGDLWNWIDADAEAARSLWDRQFLIAHLDIEYVNFDFVAEAYLKPLRCFELQRPVVCAIQEVLLHYGIAPLHLLSGRGHHFVWQVHRDSAAVHELVDLGRLPDTLAARYARPQPPAGEPVPPDLGTAFAGLGQVMEFVSHRVMAASADACQVPLDMTDVEVEPGRHGREMISIDLSEYADPLCTRSIRIPFTVYLKPLQQHFTLTSGSEEQLPLLFMIPLHEMDERQGLLAMRDVGEVLELARVASTHIPECSQGTAALTDAYRQSQLARFHRYFYSADHDPPSDWPRTYDRTSLEMLPPCAQQILSQPNDRLLKPAGIQHVVRVLLSSGWHPRHIAGLIRSKYERDYGWGEQWYEYDAASRADFYTRMFAGRVATAQDDLCDLNCRSVQVKAFCSAEQCDASLDAVRLRLLSTRNDWETSV